MQLELELYEIVAVIWPISQNQVVQFHMTSGFHSTAKHHSVLLAESLQKLSVLLAERPEIFEN